MRESWRIASKLIWSIIKLFLETSLRYYLLPIIVTGLIIYADALFLSHRSLVSTGLSVDDKSIYSFFAILFAASVAFVTWLYFLNIKFRFIWFIFLDHYRTDNFSHQLIFKRQEELNNVMKTEGFKRALIASLGTSVVSVVLNGVTRAISVGAEIAGSTINQIGSEILGGIVSIYGREFSRQVTSLSGIAAFYILYREALRYNGEKESSINQAIYDLAK